MTRRVPPRVLTAATAAGVALGVSFGLRPLVRPRPRWVRRNYRDREVLLSGGPAVAAGAVAAAAAAGVSPVVAGAAAAGLGLYDDLYGDSHARGLRGHVQALRSGRVTTGMVKLAGLVTSGFVASRLHGRRPAPALLDAALVAGMANLVNLLDLRPGRALKAVVLVGLAASVPGAGAAGAGAAGAGAAAAGAAGAAVAILPADLGEKVMIGDCGANALGALLGWRFAASGSPATRLASLAGVTALTLASERVSFSEVIARTPWLRAIDAAGRR